MSVATASKLRLGNMLVAAELINSAQLQAALEAQRVSGVRLGKQLVEMGCVSEVQVTQILSNQLSVPWVSIARVEFSQALLELVPAELADRFSMVPIYVRTVHGQGRTLYVAMDDPTDAEALLAVNKASGLAVRPMVAPPSEIRAAIERRYFGEGDESVPAPPPGYVLSPGPGMRVASGNSGLSREAAPVGTGKRPAPPPAKAARAGEPGEVPLELYAAPSAPPAAHAPSARTLTLLDGTTLALPTAGRSKAGSQILEVRHVAKSLLAAQKAGAAGGPPRWEEVVQLLIDVMRDRGVSITRREFVEAWLRRRGG